MFKERTISVLNNQRYYKLLLLLLKFCSVWDFTLLGTEQEINSAKLERYQTTFRTRSKPTSRRYIEQIVIHCKKQKKMQYWNTQGCKNSPVNFMLQQLSTSPFTNGLKPWRKKNKNKQTNNIFCDTEYYNVMKSDTLSTYCLQFFFFFQKNPAFVLLPELSNYFLIFKI